ncbi:hypothetical protein H1P_4250004 [Hyella patelloides LEGE 07179]|uniref:Uncharacterized protein n=1 Tax=Hyella patelloides LEGE 07179 TaxID=945734 RepID=A0A563VXZ3_9CYAN|nr:hypothetical protein H1P_4250004 [Hyella patelloides LEGE 07179]
MFPKSIQNSPSGTFKEQDCSTGAVEDQLKQSCSTVIAGG